MGLQIRYSSERGNEESLAVKNWRIALIGAGHRGRALAALAKASKWQAQVVAVADPVAQSRQIVAERMDVRADRCFEHHKPLLDHQSEFDAVIIAAPVHLHATLATDCLCAGIPSFLEKPMTRTIDEAIELHSVQKTTNTPLFIGFNLRFARFYRRLKELVHDGAAGQVFSIEWKEVLSAEAWADGYCRSTWYSRSEEVGGWLLEKSCHDIDQLNWLSGTPCIRVASFGSRRHFIPRADVPTRCTDGCPIESECDFYCYKLHPNGPESLPEFVPPHRWDLCVYHGGSNLVDRQVAILEYENGLTAAFSLLPIGNRWERLMRICGSEGTIRGCDSRNEIHLYRHDREEPVIADPPTEIGGHGGADPNVIDAFFEFLENPFASIETNVDVGLESMLTAGGIELARQQNRVIELNPWRVKSLSPTATS